MSADPTAERIDAIHTLMDDANPRARARAVLTSTDPAVHAALAASLPAEAMLAALVDRLGHDEWRLRFRNGSATRETDDFEDIARWMQSGDVVEARRVLPAQSTPWEVAP